jgi:hypothetical protein
MAEQRKVFSGIQEVFRGAELLAGDVERLETLYHESASAPFCVRQVSLTSQQFTYISNSDRNLCRQQQLQVPLSANLQIFAVLSGCKEK